MKIGYIGLGNMGAPLAERLLGRQTLAVFDIDAAAVARAVSLGAEACTSVPEIAKHCEIVFLCLPTSDHVRRVIFGDDGLAGTLRPGALIVDQTTGDPIASRKMAEELGKLGLEIVDAPVSGGPEGAKAGTIAILVGGTDEQFSRIVPVLNQISPNVFHAGRFGTGYVAKLTNNLLFAAQRVMTLEVVAMAAKNGLEPKKAVEILMAGSARNFFLEHTMVPRILTGKLDSGFTLGLSHKDVRLATELGLASDVPMMFGNLVREFYQMCINELGRDAQVNTIALVMDRLAGTRIVPSQSSS
jgi:3-hydroxyisobutyrate dehydrogenase